jgi:hypothetical protein
MKIRRALARRRVLSRYSEQGTAVIVMIAFLALLLVYLAANVLTLSHLGRELTLLEQKQTRRLARQVARTNVVQQTVTQSPAFGNDWPARRALAQ